MNIEVLKKQLLDSKIQVIEVDNNGTVISSDDTIFKVSSDFSVNDIDPFFEGISTMFPVTENLNFPCINLSINETDYIMDVLLHSEKGKNHLLLFDFTEHYQDSHTLAQEKNEASISKYELSFAKEILLAKEEMKNNFIASINHEIRNPLNNLIGFIDILKDTKLDYEQQSIMQVMQKTGKQLKVLMDDLLDIVKIERGVYDHKNVPFNLKIFLTDLQNHFNTKRGKKSFEIVLPEEVPTKLVGDPTRLYQIFFNLIDNAFKNAVSSNVIVDVSLSKPIEDKMVSIDFKVSDNGKGIEQASLNKIFDSYYQLQLEKIKPVGQGLGLKIVKDFVELLGGTITVKSEVNKGTTFSFSLPFKVRNTNQKRNTVPKGSGIILGKRLLVVEDDETNLILLMKSFLNNDKGFHMELAKDGEQALKLLEKRKYRLVILKANYKDMGAKELIASIRNHEDVAIQELPVLMVSGHSLAQEQKAFLDAGASSFLTKPYTKKELFKRIEKLL